MSTVSNRSTPTRSIPIRITPTRSIPVPIKPTRSITPTRIPTRAIRAIRATRIINTPSQNSTPPSMCGNGMDMYSLIEKAVGENRFRDAVMLLKFQEDARIRLIPE